ncbi:MAG: homocysteine S-methyltransferase family protein, partial [Nitrosopumilaceae archaeon]|nr:homocysteine S-methyltransferase family protein [Nitrosopumilaceae archaeon]
MKLRERLQDARTLLLDGAMGTELQKYEPGASDYPDGKTGFNDGLCITHPEWVQSVYRSYLEAGADCLTTNTFGSNTIKLDEYGLGADTEKINEGAARLAREVADSFSEPQRYVVGSMGPTGYLPSITHKPEEEISLDVVEDAFYRQAVGLVRGGVDGLVLETSVDLLELRTAIRAARRADKHVPILANITLAQAGRMLLGTPIEAAYTTVSDMGIDAFGINCSTGPLEMEDCILWLDGSATHPILVVPNAGIPDISEVDG